MKSVLSGSFLAEKGVLMGKSLKGKECGKGICQRKDGLFEARFTDRRGKRRKKYFKTLPEARNWLEDAKFEKRGRRLDIVKRA